MLKINTKLGKSKQEETFHFHRCFTQMDALLDRHELLEVTAAFLKLTEICELSYTSKAARSIVQSVRRNFIPTPSIEPNCENAPELFYQEPAWQSLCAALWRGKVFVPEELRKQVGASAAAHPDLQLSPIPPPVTCVSRVPSVIAHPCERTLRDSPSSS